MTTPVADATPWMAEDIRGARVLITGASGFIGRSLCRALHSQGADVLALVRGVVSRDLVASEVHQVDLQDREAVRGFVRHATPDHVVHLAAVKASGLASADYYRSYRANLIATLDLAEAIIDAGRCKRFVYLGSAEEYGCAPVPFESTAREVPLTAYGLSKLAATQLLQAMATTHGLPIAVLRATVVYGPGQQGSMFVPALVRALIMGERFPMTPGYQKRDLVYVDDVVEGILRALVMTTRHNDALHLSAGTPVTIRDVALLIARLTGGNAESLLEFGAIPYRSGEAMEYWAGNSETRTALGWAPSMSLEDGLARTIAYFRGTLVGK